MSDPDVLLEETEDREGPFEFAAQAAGAMPTMAHAGGADFSLLQDGADAYIAYGAWHNYKLTEGWRAEW